MCCISLQSPYPETTGLSLNSPHPLREINRENRQEVDFVELEQGTSALSTPSSFHVSGIAHHRKLKDSSGLNMFLDFSEGGDDKHFSGW